jgi:hypothetical protein
MGASVQRITQSIPAPASTHPLAVNRALRLYARAHGLSLAQHAVFMALSEFRDASGIVWPSVSTMAAHAGCSERTVQEALPVLVAKGLLSVVAPSTPRRPTVYRVAFPGVSQPVLEPTAEDGPPKQPPIQVPPPSVEPSVATKTPGPGPVRVRCSERTPGVQRAHPKENIEEINKNTRAGAQACAREAHPGLASNPESVPSASVVPTPATPPTSFEPMPAPRMAPAALGAALSSGERLTRRERSQINRTAWATMRQTEHLIRITSCVASKEPAQGPRASPSGSLTSKRIQSPAAADTSTPLRDLSLNERTRIVESLRAWRQRGCQGTWTYS